MSSITQFLLNHGGPVLFAIVFVEQAGLPLPSAPWLLAAGALSANGKLSPALAIGVTAIAALMADSVWFYIGRRGGQRVVRLFCRLSLARNSCVGRTKGLFARHGLQALTVAKFLPGLGTVMPPLAGALGMPTGRFFLFDGLGSLFYGTFYIVVGFIFHDQLQQAMALLKQFGFSALMLMVGLVLGYIPFKYARRHIASGKRRQELAANAKLQVDSEQPVVLSGEDQQTHGHLPDERLNLVEFPGVARALTNASSSIVSPHDTATLVLHHR